MRADGVTRASGLPWSAPSLIPRRSSRASPRCPDRRAARARGAPCGRRDLGGGADRADRRRAGAVRNGAAARDGLGRVRGGARAAPDAPDEEAVYRALGVAWCPPELREAPFRGEPPVLLRESDIRGDLHCHTTWSDGRATVEEMGRAGLERGYDYLAICDHTPAVGAVPGLTADDVRRQGEEIAAANERLAPFRVLRGIECDILPDGRLDLPDDVLAELDWVQASVHGGQRMPRREMTARVEEALRNPYVRCLSHPTGRYINRRPENALDLERVFEVALEEGVALEVNGLPLRLDLRGGARPGRAPGGDRDRLLDRRALRARAGQHAVRGRDRPPRVGDGRLRGQHAPVAGDRDAAPAADAPLTCASADPGCGPSARWEAGTSANASDGGPAELAAAGRRAPARRRTAACARASGASPGRRTGPGGRRRAAGPGSGRRAGASVRSRSRRSSSPTPRSRRTRRRRRAPAARAARRSTASPRRGSSRWAGSRAKSTSPAGVTSEISPEVPQLTSMLPFGCIRALPKPTGSSASPAPPTRRRGGDASGRAVPLRAWSSRNRRARASCRGQPRSVFPLPPLSNRVMSPSGQPARVVLRAEPRDAGGDAEVVALAAQRPAHRARRAVDPVDGRGVARGHDDRRVPRHGRLDRVAVEVVPDAAARPRDGSCPRAARGRASATRTRRAGCRRRSPGPRSR